MPEPHVIALDLGTSSVRAMVFDLRGAAVEGLKAQAETGLRTDASGAAEMDPGRLVDLAAGCLDQVLDRARGVPIAAVGVCTF